jgi:alkanesulfonate monooxygenase SsuD/methylene tetrahydromethanopterin reductase-like flavin-dependent oxidoreductase (luciferase family)
MLDYLTGGRLEIGVGSGGNLRETVLAGLDPAEISDRYASGLALLETAAARRRVFFAPTQAEADDIVQAAPDRRPLPRGWPVWA